MKAGLQRPFCRCPQSPSLGIARVGELINDVDRVGDGVFGRHGGTFGNGLIEAVSARMCIPVIPDIASG
jgi:hypothetical protein